MATNSEKIFEKIRNNIIKQKNKLSLPSFVVVKITEDCNLRCDYCYTEGGKNKKVIDVEDVINLFDQISLGNSGKIVCLFHGGEPLMHISVIEKIINELNKKYYSPRISYRIQTNGTIVNKKIIDVIKKNKISVGVSLDGYKTLNDQHRKQIDGGGTFDTIMKNIDYFRNENIKIGILNLITKSNVNHIEEILNFYKENNLYNISFSIFAPSGYGKSIASMLIPNQSELVKNVKKEILWLIKNNENALKTNEETITEREIKYMAQRILFEGKCSYMCKSIPCGAGTMHISLESNGDINICDALYGIKECVIGNIKNKTLIEILKNPLIKRFSERYITNIKKCSKCNLNRYCHGGCPAENIIYNNSLDGVSRESYNCKFLYEIYDFLLKIYDESKEKLHFLC